MSVKEEVIRAIESLPDDATVEDAIESLYLLFKVQRGLEQLDSGQGITQEEARARMTHWLK
jgi:hypothetical protein